MGASNSITQSITKDFTSDWSLNQDSQDATESVAQLFCSIDKSIDNNNSSTSVLYSLNHLRRRNDLEQGKERISQQNDNRNTSKSSSPSSMSLNCGGPGITDKVDVVHTLEMLVLSDALVNDTTSNNDSGSNRQNGNKISKWMFDDALHYAALRPNPSIHFNAVMAIGVHCKLMQLRSYHEMISGQSHDDIAVIASAISAARHVSPFNTNDQSNINEQNQSLSMSVSIGIRLFFKLLRSLQRAGHVHGLLRLASSLPPLLASMGPRALASKQKPLHLLQSGLNAIQVEIKPLQSYTSSTLNNMMDEDEKKSNIIEETENVNVSSEVVVKAVWDAVEELSSLDPNLLGVDNHAATLSALVALAVKRGELHPLLKASGILLFGRDFSDLSTSSPPSSDSNNIDSEEVNKENHQDNSSAKTTEPLKRTLVGSMKRYAVPSGRVAQQPHDEDSLEDTQDSTKGEDGSHNEYKQEDGEDGKSARIPHISNSIPVLSSLLELKATVDHAPEILCQSTTSTKCPIPPSISGTGAVSDVAFETDEEVMSCDNVALGTPWWTPDLAPSFPGQKRSGSGFLMTFGRSDHGKLGHGMYVQDNRTAQKGSGSKDSSNKQDLSDEVSSSSFIKCDVPKPVAALAGVSLKNINSLSTHSVALTETGSLLTWGNGERYRLGHGTEERECFPRLLGSLRDRPPVKHVSCGLAHTLALLTNGHVLSWGNGGNGRLGVGDRLDRNTPTCVTRILPNVITTYHMKMNQAHNGTNENDNRSNKNDIEIATISCGASHSIAIDSLGCVWTWGKNNQGQCGVGHINDVLIPENALFVMPVLSQSNEFLDLESTGPMTSPLRRSASHDVATPNEYRGLRQNNTSAAVAALNDDMEHLNLEEEAFPVGNAVAAARLRALTANAQLPGGSVTPGTHHRHTANSESGNGSTEELSDFDRLLASPTTRSPGSYLRQSMGLPDSASSNGGQISDQAYTDAVNAAAHAVSSDNVNPNASLNGTDSNPPVSSTSYKNKKDKNQVSTFVSDMFVSAAGGWEHSLFLTANGNVWSCGGGYKETPPVLGHGSSKPEMRPKRIEILGPVVAHDEGLENNEKEDEDDDDMDHVSELNASMSTSKRQPNEEEVNKGKPHPSIHPGGRTTQREFVIVHVACGWDHSLAVSRNGECLSWGAGQHGKLGHGDEKPRSIPTLIKLFETNDNGEGVKVVLAEAGCEHSAAVTAEGDLYTWGNANSGRLGHGSNNTDEQNFAWSISSRSSSNKRNYDVQDNLLKNEKNDENENEKSILFPKRVEMLSSQGIRVVNLAVGDKYNMILVRPASQEVVNEKKKFNGNWIRSQPNMELNTSNESVNGEIASLFILSQLERLVSKQVISLNNINPSVTHSNDNCIKLLSNNSGNQSRISSPKASEPRSKLVLPLPTTWPFALDSGLETFELLLALLKRSFEKAAGWNSDIDSMLNTSTTIDTHPTDVNSLSSSSTSSQIPSSTSETSTLISNRTSNKSPSIYKSSKQSKPGSVQRVPDKSTSTNITATSITRTTLLGPVGGDHGYGGGDVENISDDVVKEHKKLVWIISRAMKYLSNWGDEASPISGEKQDSDLEVGFVTWSVIFSTLRILRANINHLILLSSASTEAVSQSKSFKDALKQSRYVPNVNKKAHNNEGREGVDGGGGNGGDMSSSKDPHTPRRDGSMKDDEEGDEEIQAAIYASLNHQVPDSPPRPQRLSFRMTDDEGAEEKQKNENVTTSSINKNNVSALSKMPSNTRLLNEVLSELHALFHAIVVALPSPFTTNHVVPTPVPLDPSQSNSVEAATAAASAVLRGDNGENGKGGNVAVMALQQEAVACISEAFPLLYPSFASRVRLLKVLVKQLSASSGDSPSDSKANTPAHTPSPSPPASRENGKKPIPTSSPSSSFPFSGTIPLSEGGGGLESTLEHPYLLSALISQVMKDDCLSEIVTRAFMSPPPLESMFTFQDVQEVLFSMIGRCLVSSRSKLHSLFDSVNNGKSIEMPAMNGENDINESNAKYKSVDEGALKVLVTLQTHVLSHWVETVSKNETLDVKSSTEHANKLVLLYMERLLNASRRTIDEVSSLLSNWQRKSKTVSTSSIENGYEVIINLISILRSSFWGESLISFCVSIIALADQVDNYSDFSSNTSMNAQWQLISVTASTCLPILLPLLRDVDHVNQVISTIVLKSTPPSSPPLSSSLRPHDWLLEAQGSLACAAARLALSALVRGPPHLKTEGGAVPTEGLPCALPKIWSPLAVVMGWRAAGVYIGSAAAVTSRNTTSPSSSGGQEANSGRKSRPYPTSSRGDRPNSSSSRPRSNSRTRRNSDNSNGSNNSGNRRNSGTEFSEESNAKNEKKGEPAKFVVSENTIEGSLDDFRAEVRKVGLEITKHLLLSTSSPKPTARIVRELSNSLNIKSFNLKDDSISSEGRRKGAENEMFDILSGLENASEVSRDSCLRAFSTLFCALSHLFRRHASVNLASGNVNSSSSNANTTRPSTASASTSSATRASNVSSTTTASSTRPVSSSRAGNRFRPSVSQSNTTAKNVSSSTVSRQSITSSSDVGNNGKEVSSKSFMEIEAREVLELKLEVLHACTVAITPLLLKISISSTYANSMESGSSDMMQSSLSASESLQVLETITDSGIVPLLGNLLTSAGDIFASSRTQTPSKMLLHALKAIDLVKNDASDDVYDNDNIRMSFRDAHIVASRSKRALSLLPLRAYHTALRESLGLENEVPTNNCEDDGFIDAATAIGLDYLENRVSFGYQVDEDLNELTSNGVRLSTDKCFQDICNTLKSEAMIMGTHRAALELLQLLSVQAVSINACCMLSRDDSATASMCSSPTHKASSNETSSHKHDFFAVGKVPSGETSNSFDSSSNTNSKKLKASTINQVESLMDATCSVIYNELNRAIIKTSLIKNLEKKRERSLTKSDSLYLKSSPYTVVPTRSCIKGTDDKSSKQLKEQGFGFAVSFFVWLPKPIINDDVSEINNFHILNRQSKGKSGTSNSSIELINTSNGWQVSYSISSNMNAMDSDKEVERKSGMNDRRVINRSNNQESSDEEDTTKETNQEDEVDHKDEESPSNVLTSSYLPHSKWVHVCCSLKRLNKNDKKEEIDDKNDKKGNGNDDGSMVILVDGVSISNMNLSAPPMSMSGDAHFTSLSNSVESEPVLNVLWCPVVADLCWHGKPVESDIATSLSQCGIRSEENKRGLLAGKTVHQLSTTLCVLASMETSSSSSRNSIPPTPNSAFASSSSSLMSLSRPSSSNNSSSSSNNNNSNLNIASGGGVFSRSGFNPNETSSPFDSNKKRKVGILSRLGASEWISVLIGGISEVGAQPQVLLFKLLKLILTQADGLPGSFSFSPSTRRNLTDTSIVSNSTDGNGIASNNGCRRPSLSSTSMVASQSALVRELCALLTSASFRCSSDAHSIEERKCLALIDHHETILQRDGVDMSQAINLVDDLGLTQSISSSIKHLPVEQAFKLSDQVSATSSLPTGKLGQTFSNVPPGAPFSGESQHLSHLVPSSTDCNMRQAYSINNDDNWLYHNHVPWTVSEIKSLLRCLLSHPVWRSVVKSTFGGGLTSVHTQVIPTNSLKYPSFLQPPSNTSEKISNNLISIRKQENETDDASDDVGLKTVIMDDLKKKVTISKKQNENDIDADFVLRKSSCDPRKATQSAASSLPAAFSALETLTSVEDSAQFIREGVNVSIMNGCVSIATFNKDNVFNKEWNEITMKLLNDINTRSSSAFKSTSLKLQSVTKTTLVILKKHRNSYNEPLPEDLDVCVAVNKTKCLLLKVFPATNSNTSNMKAKLSGSDDGKETLRKGSGDARNTQMGSTASNKDDLLKSTLLQSASSGNKESSTLPIEKLNILSTALVFIPKHALSNVQKFQLFPCRSNKNSFSSKDSSGMGGIYAIVPLNCISRFIPKEEKSSMSSILDDLIPRTLPALSWFLDHKPSLTCPPLIEKTERSNLGNDNETEYVENTLSLMAFDLERSSTKSTPGNCSKEGLSDIAEWLSEEQLHFDASLLATKTHAATLRGVAISLDRQAAKIKSETDIKGSRPLSQTDSGITGGVGLNTASKNSPSVHAILRDGMLNKFLTIACMDLTCLLTTVLGGHEARVAKYLPSLAALSDYLSKDVDLNELESLAKQLWDRLALISPQARAPWMRAHNNTFANLVNRSSSEHSSKNEGSSDASSRSTSEPSTATARSQLLDMLNQTEVKKASQCSNLVDLKEENEIDSDTSLARQAYTSANREINTAMLKLEVIGYYGRKPDESTDLASIDTWRVRGLGAFPTLKLNGCSLSEGVWYYEAVLLTDGLMQIGWASNEDPTSTQSEQENIPSGAGGFSCEPHEGTGCGDHARSWAFDGCRRKKWNVSSTSYGTLWQVGDVVGCLLNLESREMRYSLNGQDMGVAFTDVKGGGMYPCASLNLGQAIKFNFGHSPFMYPPSHPATSAAALMSNDDDYLNREKDSSGVMRGVAEAPIWSLESAMLAKKALESISLQIPPNLALHDESNVSFPSSVETCFGQSLSHFEDNGVSTRLSSNRADGGRVRYVTTGASGGAAGSTNTATVRRNDGSEAASGSSAVDDERRHSLIENLIGMGFPVHWAVRAADQCDVSVNSSLRESLAITWIIDRMELEHAKAEEDAEDDDSDEDHEEDDEEDEEDDEEDEDENFSEEEDSEGEEVNMLGELDVTQISSTLRIDDEETQNTDQVSLSSSRRGSASNKIRSARLSSDKDDTNVGVLSKSNSNSSSIKTGVVDNDTASGRRSSNVKVDEVVDVGTIDSLFVDMRAGSKNKTSSTADTTSVGGLKHEFSSLDRASFLGEQGWEPLMSSDEWSTPSLIREGFFLPNCDNLASSSMSTSSCYHDKTDEDGLLRWHRRQYLRNNFAQHVQQTHLHGSEEEQLKCIEAILMHSHKNFLDETVDDIDDHDDEDEDDDEEKLTNNEKHAHDSDFSMSGLMNIAVNAKDEEIVALLAVIHSALGILYARRSVTNLLGAVVTSSSNGNTIVSANKGSDMAYDALMDLFSDSDSSSSQLIQFSKLCLFRNSPFMTSKISPIQTNSEIKKHVLTRDVEASSAQNIMKSLDTMFGCTDTQSTDNSSSSFSSYVDIKKASESWCSNMTNEENQKLLYKTFETLLNQSLKLLRVTLQSYKEKGKTYIDMNNGNDMLQMIKKLNNISLFWSNLITDAATQIEKAQTNTYRRVPWSGPCHVLLSLSESDTINKPNLKWSVWVLHTLIALSSVYSSQFRGIHAELVELITNTTKVNESSNNNMDKVVTCLSDLITYLDLVISPLMVEHLCHAAAYSANVPMRTLISQLVSYAFEMIQYRILLTSQKATDQLDKKVNGSIKESSNGSLQVDLFQRRDGFHKTCSERFCFPNLEKQLVVNLSAKLRKDSSMMSFIGLTIPPLLCRTDESSQSLLLLLAQWHRLKAKNTLSKHRLIHEMRQQKLKYKEKKEEEKADSDVSKMDLGHCFTIQLLDVGCSSIVVGWGRLKQEEDMEEKEQDKGSADAEGNAKVKTGEGVVKSEGVVKNLTFCENGAIKDDDNMVVENTLESKIETRTEGEECIIGASALSSLFNQDDENKDEIEDDNTANTEDNKDISKKSDGKSSKKVKNSQSTKSTDNPEILHLDYRPTSTSCFATLVSSSLNCSDDGDWTRASSCIPALGSFQIDGLNPDTIYEFRVISNSNFIKHRQNHSTAIKKDKENDKKSVEKVTMKECSRRLRVRTNLEAPFMLDVDAVGPNLRLCNGGHTVSNVVNKQWNAVRATTGWNSGSHQWEVHIDRCISKNIFVGVMCDTCPLDNYVGSDRKGWGYLANKAIWHNKGKLLTFGELFKEGDTIGVSLDLSPKSGGILSFTRNGRSLGNAIEGLLAALDELGLSQPSSERNSLNSFHGLNGGNGFKKLKDAASLSHQRPLLYPAFSLYNRDDQLSLLPSLFPSVMTIPKTIQPKHGASSSPSSTNVSHLMGTAVAESLISMFAEMMDDCHYLSGCDVLTHQKMEIGRNNAMLNKDKEVTEDMSAKDTRFVKLSHVEERSMAGVFDWWRHWRTGVHVPIANHHGELIWCCTSRDSSANNNEDDDESKDNEESEENGLKKTRQNIEKNRRLRSRYMVENDDEGEDDDVISMLGLSAGDVVEINKPNVMKASYSTSPPSVSSPLTTTRALVLGHSKSLLWVLPSTPALLTTSASVTNDAHDQDGEFSSLNGEGEGVLLRTARCTLCGTMSSSINLEHPITTGANIEGKGDKMEQNNVCDCMCNGISQGSVLWLRAGGFSISAEPWTFRSVMDMLSKEGAVTIVNPPDKKDENNGHEKTDDEFDEEEDDEEDMDMELMGSLFKQWLPCLDENLCELLELSLQSLASSCLSGDMNLAITIAAHRSLPLHLPYDFLVRATTPRTTETSRNEASNGSSTKTSQFKRKSRKCCGLFPPGNEHASISKTLHEQWMKCVDRIQNHINIPSFYTNEQKISLVTQVVRLRVAFILKLNNEVISSNRLVDWSLIHSNTESNLGTSGSSMIQEDADKVQMSTSPARLLYMNRSRLLSRTKYYMISQILIASSPTPPQHMLCPLLSWELLRGFSLPSIVSPPKGFTRQIKKEMSFEKEGSLKYRHLNKGKNDSDTDSDGDIAMNELRVPFSKLYFNNASSALIQAISHDTKVKKVISGDEENNSEYEDKEMLSITITINSLNDFIYKHLSTPSSLFDNETDLNLNWTQMKKSAFGQFMYQISKMNCCELRHQVAKVSACNATRTTMTSNINEEEVEASNYCLQPNWLVELQARSLDIFLIELPEIDLPPIKSMMSTTPYPSAVVWRSLLFSICREVQGSIVPLFQQVEDRKGSKDDTNTLKYGVNGSFLRDNSSCNSFNEDANRNGNYGDDINTQNISTEAMGSTSDDETQSSLIKERETARIGWYLGIGQVMGMAVRTGVKLPLNLSVDFWTQVTIELKSMSNLKGGKSDQQLDTDLSDEICSSVEEVRGVVDGLTSILPRETLMFLSDTEMRNLVCLPSSVSVTIMKQLWT